jgi:hypothetical protein
MSSSSAKYEPLVPTASAVAAETDEEMARRLAEEEYYGSAAPRYYYGTWRPPPPPSSTRPVIIYRRDITNSDPCFEIWLLWWVAGSYISPRIMMSKTLGHRLIKSFSPSPPSILYPLLYRFNTGVFWSGSSFSLPSYSFWRTITVNHHRDSSGLASILRDQRSHDIHARRTPSG